MDRKSLSAALISALVGLVLIAPHAQARDVYVHGYTRSNGTYVAPHYRAPPNNTRADNYGPSRESYQRLMPSLRDNDHDALPNYLDHDDDNDGVTDDSDRSQYGRSDSSDDFAIRSPRR